MDWRQPLLDVRELIDQTALGAKYYIDNPDILYPGMVASVLAVITFNIGRGLFFAVKRKMVGRAPMPPITERMYRRGIMADVIQIGLQKAYYHNLINLRDRNFLFDWAANGLSLPEVKPNRHVVTKTKRIPLAGIRLMRKAARKSLAFTRAATSSSWWPSFPGRKPYSKEELKSYRLRHTL
jgi:hypothetical protein